MSELFNPSELVGTRPEVGGLVPKCGACRLFKGCHSPKMEPYGQGRRKLLIVGEAPGEDEDREGRPFVGKAGAYLRTVFKRLGFDMDRDAWTTNSLICRPPNNAKPDPKQISFCHPNLAKTLSNTPPRVVVTLGHSALASLMLSRWSVSRLEQWIGWQIPFSPFWVCPTYHPSYLLRVNDPSLNKSFENHLKAALRIEEPPKEKEDLSSLIIISYDEDQVEKTLVAMDAVVSVDYETNCLKPEYPEAKIYSCAVSDGQKTISYPWTPRSRKATGGILFSSRKKVAANMKFEERWTRKAFGRGVRNWDFDTMLAAHCLDNRSGICSLKFQAFVRLGVGPYNKHIEPFLESHKGHYNRIQQLSMESILLYGGIDALCEHRLATIQKKGLSL